MTKSGHEKWLTTGDTPYAKAQRQRMINYARGRDPDTGRAPFFEPDNRGATSPLGGRAQPAQQPKTKSTT